MSDLPHFWTIEPRDPLIVRDGRPFGPNPGARATTLPFPFPSTVVGALRHKDGLNAQGLFPKGNQQTIDRVLTTELRGPLLVELDDNGGVVDWLLPAPADALLLDTEPASTSLLRRWLAPRKQLEGVASNQPVGLALIGPAQREESKVSTSAPRFWYSQGFAQWLEAPTDDQPLHEIGIGALDINSRTHVSINPETQTAREGALFQTSGLEFTWRDREAKGQRFLTKRLALAAWSGGRFAHFAGGIAAMGGERRMMRWTRHAAGISPIIEDEAKQRIIEEVVASGRCRVVLLTPALFDNGDERSGYRPALAWMRGGMQANLKAALVPRMQTVSGWDLALDTPKATRRLAPAGSVYFVAFDGGDKDAIRAWLAATWLHNVSDAPKDQDDGFGLALVGTWPHEQSKHEETPA